MGNAIAERTMPNRPAFGGPVGRGAVLGALAVGLAVLTAACGGSSPSPASSGGANTGTPTGTQVKATLTEFHIGLSQTAFAAGTYTFVVSNNGTMTHGFVVNGPGVNAAHTPDIDSGKSANLTVNFQTGGGYDIFCPVDGHRGLGMETHVSVGTGGAASPTSAPPTATTTNGGGGGGGNGGGY